ncbi:glutamine synthetase [Micrococcales bacterium 31B]|nr:glutamine synthetase [Micrococcales bacterium 31B]
MAKDRLLTVEQLKQLITEGVVDTVIAGFTDMQGRLQGKVLHASYFLSDVLAHGTEGCNYLLAVDVDMNTVAGYKMSSWETGYGDMRFEFDFGTIRELVHRPGTVMIQCDLTDHHGGPIAPSPRAILAKQVQRAKDLGFVALAGTELEFVLYDTTYRDAWKQGYRDLEPANYYNVDYSLLGSDRVEPLLREIRAVCDAAGLLPESAKGECNFGQHEIAFKYDDVLTTADNHVIYKHIAKTLANDYEQAITFMAKPNQREGNSCHIHMSLRSLDGDIVFWKDGQRTPLYESFIAGVLATMNDFTLFYAPNINSYKRFAKGSFAPTAIAWGLDNRTCSVRLVGEGPAARMENRLPGGDVNPYLAVAAMLAGGLHGIENQLTLEPETRGNAYESGAPSVPTNLYAARDALANSAVARAALGDEVVEHYLNYADVELSAFEASVTDWELVRGFERL